MPHPDATPEEYVFSHSGVILRRGNIQYYYVRSPDQLVGDAQIRAEQFLDSMIPVPPSLIHPPFDSTAFTRAPTPIPDNWYVKRARTLFEYSPEKGIDVDVADVVQSEAKVCEVIKAAGPHPNVATYYGCEVSQADGQGDELYITGLCFRKYRMTLEERLDDPWSWPLDVDKFMRGIKAGVQHLHSLGLVHCDLFPENIMMDENDVPVIIDFDCARPMGQGMSDKGTACEWTNPELTHAGPENDWYSVERIREFLTECDGGAR
ncbi:putative serine threonine-protein kinase [Diplodia seriata]|uniref:Putative serine threonine-protein kinase n=1 Tax=Diplodia seriata TaxID=420778 RepID=A0A0G2GX21_9PEZI|nr:putative serine threonine-protein kinase [Diplodia seriata]